MRKRTIRSALLGILLLVFMIPGAALAGDGEKGCSNLGTWFGVIGPGDTRLTGWSATVAGKSNNAGTNILTFPTFDPTLGLEDPPFSLALTMTEFRGNWVRTGASTFDYTFMGLALGEANLPVYIAKISGQVSQLEDCQYQYTTAVMEVFLPFMSPFHMEPIATIPLGEFYAFRAMVDLPF